MPNKEEQIEFFTQTYDDDGEDEKRTSALKAGMKLQDHRRLSMPSTSAPDDAVEPGTAVVSKQDAMERALLLLLLLLLEM